MSRSSTTDGRACALCDRPVDPAYRPFCSRGCRDRDLLKWLGDGYALPGPAADEEGLDSSAAPPL